MPRARREKRLRVWLQEVDDPIEVQTSRLDWVAVQMDPNKPMPLDMICQVAHRALLRTGHDVPTSYIVFLDKCLDGDVEILEPGDPEEMDPTQPVP